MLAPLMLPFLVRFVSLQQSAVQEQLDQVDLKDRAVPDLQEQLGKQAPQVKLEVKDPKARQESDCKAQQAMLESESKGRKAVQERLERLESA